MQGANSYRERGIFRRQGRVVDRLLGRRHSRQRGNGRFELPIRGRVRPGRAAGIESGPSKQAAD